MNKCLQMTGYFKSRVVNFSTSSFHEKNGLARPSPISGTESKSLFIRNSQSTGAHLCH